MTYLGIDPGATESGIAVIDENYEIFSADKISNEKLIDLLYNDLSEDQIDVVVVESIQSYGMTMGKTIIDTCYMIGRIIQVCKYYGVECCLIPPCTLR